MYRTRIRQAPPPAAGPRGRVPEGRRSLEFMVEVYIGGTGWLPLADGSGRGIARFPTRRAARGHAGLVERRDQVLGAHLVR